MEHRTPRVQIRISPEALILFSRIEKQYPTIGRGTIGAMALEAGLRQIAVPSGASSPVRLPVEPNGK